MLLRLQKKLSERAIPISRAIPPLAWPRSSSWIYRIFAITHPQTDLRTPADPEAAHDHLCHLPRLQAQAPHLADYAQQCWWIWAPL